MRKAIWILLALIVVVLPAAAQRPVDCLATETIAQGSMSGANVSGTCEGNCPGLDLIIEDERTWAKVWARHTSNLNPAPSLPKVDFRRQFVLASFLGSRATTFHGVDIECVSTGGIASVFGVSLSVDVTDISPGANCIVQPAITNPFHFVKLDRPRQFVSIGVKPRIVARFHHSDYVIPCSGGDDPLCRICPTGGGLQDIVLDDVPCCP